MSEPVVKVENLNVWYGKPQIIGRDKRVHILHDVSFEIKRGEILGLVGESGCGKSTLARAILGIETGKTGTIIHNTFRPQMVFQNPYGSLNPYKKIGWIIEEPLRVQRKYDSKERKRRGLELLADRCRHLTVVTNEVFSGGDEYEGDTLAYLQDLAALNRELARRADLVIEMVCGVPHVLKGELP